MTTQSDAITQLSTARDAMITAANGLSLSASQYLWTTIGDINSEISAAAASGLASASYIPQTDNFKAMTDEGKQFIGELHDIQKVFGTIDAVVKAATSIISLIMLL